MYFSTPSLVCVSERGSHGGQWRDVFEDVIGEICHDTTSRISEFWCALQKYHLDLETFLIRGRWKSVLINSHLCWLWKRHHQGLYTQAGRDVLWLDDSTEVRREMIQLFSQRNFGTLLGPRDKY